MKTVPYIGNPDDISCALACYTMAAQYLFPEKDLTYDQIADISHRKPGYVIWGFAFWKWLIEQGANISDFDAIDYETWGYEGIVGLQNSVSQRDFEYLQKHTYDLEAETGYIRQLFKTPGFTYTRGKLKWETVIEEFNKPGICDLTIDLQTLNKNPGYSLHRVILIDITDTEVIFHDPNPDSSGAYRHESLAHFQAAFNAQDEPELAHYWRP